MMENGYGFDFDLQPFHILFFKKKGKSKVI